MCDLFLSAALRHKVLSVILTIGVGSQTFHVGSHTMRQLFVSLGSLILLARALHEFRSFYLKPYIIS